jgi:hypothetical protein
MTFSRRELHMKLLGYAFNSTLSKSNGAEPTISTVVAGHSERSPTAFSPRTVKTIDRVFSFAVLCTAGATTSGIVGTSCTRCTKLKLDATGALQGQSLDAISTAVTFPTSTQLCEAKLEPFEQKKHKL